MYTVVVADDESELREMLVRRVKWEEIGFKVVGEAQNGAEALELVEKLEPDLLLTDIRMPFISGLELARQVREVRPNVQIAFLSGYDDFSYAQQAIQYNIISYMLKPISNAELTEELKVIKKKIDDKFMEFSSKKISEQDSAVAELFLPLILDEYGLDNLQEKDAELTRAAIECGFIREDNADNMNYVVIVSKMVDQEGRNTTTKANVNAINSILEKYVHFVSFFIEGRIVSLLSATDKGFEKYMHILTEEIVQSARRILGCNCVLGVSRVYKSISLCHECYIEAMNAITYAGNIDNTVNFITDKERNGEIDQDKLESFIKEIERNIRGGNENQRDLLEAFFEELDKEKMPFDSSNYIAMQFITAVYRVVYSVAGNEAISQLQNESDIENIIMFKNRQDAFDKYLKLCVGAKNIVREQLKKSSDVICNEALSIVENDFGNPDLSLVSVSNEIAVSPNYLSALLKKTTGKTFVEHLTGKRMKVAVELLKNTDYKIREIAEKCGYNDQHYFSYCFKKYTGESPNNCRSVING